MTEQTIFNKDNLQSSIFNRFMGVGVVADRSIVDLPTLLAGIEQVPPLLYATLTEGQNVVPPPMELWATQTFGSLDAVRRQQIVRVRNLWTLEEALFNPLRARRPIERADGDLEEYIAARLAHNRDFADPYRRTTEDSFGRIEGRFCTSAANVAKVEGLHGLVLFHEPHPLHFGPEQVSDYLDVALRWLQTAHKHDPAACYPLIIWNCLPHSGATIVHGHMQMMLGHTQHYARVEYWRRCALAYAGAAGCADTGCAAYFSDLVALHETLGLGCYTYNDVRAVASLTPARNREVLLLAKEVGPNLAKALAHTLRAMIDNQGMRSFNVAIFMPPFGTVPEAWHGFPIIARIVDRGEPLSLSSDLGAIEIFASNAISTDPFVVARLIHNA